MFNVVLFEPEIPPNTGNIIRLCANTGARLHLIKPLGFSMQDKMLRRAGLDYHEFASIQYYDDWQDFVEKTQASPLYLLTTKGSQSISSVSIERDAWLVFGPETRGLPDEILNVDLDHTNVRLPMLSGSRSMNLSNTVAVVLFDAWRQHGYEGGS